MDSHYGRESNLQDFDPNAIYANEENSDNLINEQEQYAQYNDPIDREAPLLSDQNNYGAPDPQQFMSLQQQHAPDPQTFMPLQQANPGSTNVQSTPEFQNVRVSFPTSTDSKINAYMIYKIRFTVNGNDFVVNRRFSDFTSLRYSLRVFLPCHYIFPVHRKKTIVR